MSPATKPLIELVQELPPDVQAEVRDFVEFLLAKRVRKPAQTLRQDWAGALRDVRDQYTSLELQHKALDWRGD
jgi:LPS O-antigen subunit length determinant protein (WzzB/FepE family)